MYLFFEVLEHPYWNKILMSLLAFTCFKFQTYHVPSMCRMYIVLLDKSLQEITQFLFFGPLALLRRNFILKSLFVDFLVDLP